MYLTFNFNHLLSFYKQNDITAASFHSARKSKRLETDYKFHLKCSRNILE